VKNSRDLKQKKLDLLESISRERSLPVTVQRRVVLDTLLDRQDHPTVDQLYEDVRERMPGVSRTTIYRALETLIDLGLARRTNTSKHPRASTVTPSITIIWYAGAAIASQISIFRA